MKILFIAEGATFAHTARPFVLAQGLLATDHQVTFARAPQYDWLTRDAAFPSVDLPCLPSEVVAERLRKGAPLYDYGTLEQYVRDDLNLIRQVGPDVIIGDFRLSLSVSARLAARPYISICDAYWSPNAPGKLPLPVLPLTRQLPLAIATAAFSLAAPIAFRLHAHSLERVRSKHGLSSLNHDLRNCYTDADLRLFPNFESLFPDLTTEPQDRFLGPIAWSPSTTTLPSIDLTNRQVAYVSMGSSGDLGTLTTLIPALVDSGYEVLLSSGGRSLPALGTAHVRIFDFLSGDAACEAATLVVCNGGSPTSNQALRKGKPVLGIVTNMDQFLNMRSIEKYGAGVAVRSDRATRTQLEHAIARILGDSIYANRAARLAANYHPSGHLDVLQAALQGF